MFVKKQVVLIGIFSEIIEALEENDFEIVGYVDFQEVRSELLYLGTDESYIKNGDKNIPLIISPDLPAIREKLFIKYMEAGFQISELAHKNAYISRLTQKGKGVFVQRFAHISSNVILKDGVRINAMANVMHDCIIGDYTTIAPNVVILGKVSVGKSCYIGANATILPNLNIGDSVVVGAGAVVTKNVLSNSVVKGNPAK